MSTLVSNNTPVISVSRSPPEATTQGVTHIPLDCTRESSKSALAHLIKSHKIQSIVHACGLLFDTSTPLSSLNPAVSGSNSSPAGSYDEVTFQTARNALDALGEAGPPGGGSFVFVSAAEAGWPEVPGGKVLDAVAPGWLKRYLEAKRKVEKMLKEAPVRHVIIRPSIVYTPGALDSALTVAAFTFFSRDKGVGLPFVDAPVSVETVAGAAAKGVEGGEGVYKAGDIGRLAGE